MPHAFRCVRSSPNRCTTAIAGWMIAKLGVLSSDGSGDAASDQCLGLADHQAVLEAIDRVTIGAKEIEIQLSDAVVVDGVDRTLTVPWVPPSPYQRREIVQGKGEPRAPIRPMRVLARTVFAESLRNAHRWLDELIRYPDQTIQTIAGRETKSERSARMTLSLTFVAPPIVAAAIEGRLHRGFWVKRLMDLPMLWSHQSTGLGLREPPQS